MTARSLFARASNANTISDRSIPEIGLSIATSWGSGPSVILGIIFIWQYGLIPGSAWIIGNILAPSLVGLFRRCIPLSDRWVDVSLATLSLFAMYIFVECFIILINLGAIKMAFDGTGTLQKISELSLVSGNVAMFITVGIGVSIVVLIYRYGFRGSVLSDKWQ